MKKYASLLLAVLFTGMLTACADGPSASGASAPLTASPSESVSTSASSEAPESSVAGESASPVNAADGSRSAGGKPLVVYFSHTGNTKAVAERIAELTGGDLFEIRTVDAYPAEYEAATEAAKKEQNENTRPELAAALENPAGYDTVFIGYPIWWGDMPVAVYSFLDACDFSEKTILPFCTHGGSGLSGTDTRIQTEEPNAEVSAALAINASSAADAKQAVADWLKSAGIPVE